MIFPVISPMTLSVACQQAPLAGLARIVGHVKIAGLIKIVGHVKLVGRVKIVGRALVHPINVGHVVSTFPSITIT